MCRNVLLQSQCELGLKIIALYSLRNFLTAEDGSHGMGPCDKVLIIQSDFDEASQSANLIASAK